MNRALFNKIELVSKQENRRRVYFLVKLLVLTALVILRGYFPGYYEQFKISSNLIEAASIYLTSNLVITFGRLLLVNFYIKKNKFKVDFRDNFILGVNRFTSILNFLILLLATFKLFDVNIREFFTSISIVAAAIALISKDYISNMINGMIIMFSDQLSLNDQVKIGEHKGKIVDITLLNIHLINEDDDLIYIPNNTVLGSNVVNFSKSNQKKLTFDFSLPAQKTKSLHELERLLVESLQAFEDLFDNDSTRLKVIEIQKDTLLMKFQLVMKKENKPKEREIKRTINDLIISSLNQ